MLYVVDIGLCVLEVFVFMVVKEVELVFVVLYMCILVEGMVLVVGVEDLVIDVMIVWGRLCCKVVSIIIMYYIYILV